MIRNKECENALFTKVETLEDFASIEGLNKVTTFEEVEGKWFEWVGNKIYTSDHECECCETIEV